MQTGVYRLSSATMDAALTRKYCVRGARRIGASPECASERTESRQNSRSGAAPPAARKLNCQSQPISLFGQTLRGGGCDGSHAVRGVGPMMFRSRKTNDSGVRDLLRQVCTGAWRLPLRFTSQPEPIHRTQPYTPARSNIHSPCPSLCLAL